MATTTTTTNKSVATVRLSEADKAAVSEIAQREDASVAQILRRIVRRALENERQAHRAGHEAA
jgi:hypothetical protein